MSMAELMAELHSAVERYRQLRGWESIDTEQYLGWTPETALTPRIIRNRLAKVEGYIFELRRLRRRVEKKNNNKENAQ